MNFNDDCNVPMLTLMSFGFAEGKPSPDEVDHVFRLTNIPNPEVSLRKKYTGCHQELQKAIFNLYGVPERYESLKDEINRLIDQLPVPADPSEPLADLTLAFGCHTGQHRSVAIVERLGLEKWTGYQIQIIHRDVNKPSKTSREKDIKNQRRLKQQQNMTFWE